QELEFVFEQPGRIRRAVFQGADIGHAVEDPQLPVRAKVAGVAGVKPALAVLSESPWYSLKRPGERTRISRCGVIFSSTPSIGDPTVSGLTAPSRCIATKNPVSVEP